MVLEKEPLRTRSLYNEHKDIQDKTLEKMVKSIFRQILNIPMMVRKKVAFLLLALFVAFPFLFSQGPGQAPSADIDYNRKGLFRAEYGDYKGAIEDYTYGLSLKPDDIDLYINRGLAKVELKDVKGALFDFDMAIAIDSTFVRALNCRGSLFLDQKRFTEAFADFDKALKLHPNYANALINRGLTRRELKDSIGACNDWNLAGSYGNRRANDYIKRYCK